MEKESHPTEPFSAPGLLEAYERAIDENIISSITDARGQILYVNRKFCEVSQYTHAELVGQDHRIINSSFHPKEFFRNMWKTIEGGNVWHDEIRNKARDGSYYWVDTVIVPIKAGDGATSHYLSLRTLITGRKKLEATRAKHVDSLEALLVLTSQRVRKPLSTCLIQMSRLETGTTPDRQQLDEIVTSLRSTTAELDSFTKELNTYIRDMEL